MAFFSISNNVVILYAILLHNLFFRTECLYRALQGMIADFLYFITIAAICFSGLLFTLHSLGAQSYFDYLWSRFIYCMLSW
jgi:hypothetical protein